MSHTLKTMRAVLSSYHFCIQGKRFTVHLGNITKHVAKVANHRVTGANVRICEGLPRDVNGQQGLIGRSRMSKRLALSSQGPIEGRRRSIRVEKEDDKKLIEK